MICTHSPVVCCQGNIITLDPGTKGFASKQRGLEKQLNVDKRGIVVNVGGGGDNCLQRSPDPQFFHPFHGEEHGG